MRPHKRGSVEELQMARQLTDEAELMWWKTMLRMRSFEGVCGGGDRKKSRPDVGSGYVGPVGTSAQEARSKQLEGAPGSYTFCSVPPQTPEAATLIVWRPVPLSFFVFRGVLSLNAANQQCARPDVI